jgi:hypothetical protein
MNILKGRVKYTAGKVFEGQYGPSINAAITLENGTDIRVYGKPDDNKLMALKKDDVVTIIHDGKSYKVAFDMVTANELPEKIQTPTEQSEWIPPIVQHAANVVPKTNGKLTAEEISEKATFMTGIYADIFHQLQASGLEPAQAQPAAATIFIQIGKYF